MLSTEALDRRAVEREHTDLRPGAQLCLVLRGGRLPVSRGRLVLLERAALPELRPDPARPEVYLGRIPVAALTGETAAALTGTASISEAPTAAADVPEAADPQARVDITVRSLDSSHDPLQDITHGVVDESAEQVAVLDRMLAERAPDHEWTDLRRAAVALMGSSAEDEALAVAAQAVTAWHLDHPRCPRCGAVTEVRRSGWLRVCPQDASMQFPRTDPAIIVTVTDGEPGDPQERVLLGRAAAWPERRFSTLAGFVEPGESLEQAVRREVHEESGALVGDVRVLGSQPWPFPRSLMIGCTARLEGGRVAPDGLEIAELRWLTRAQLREAASTGELRLPGRVSIARALLEHWNGEPLPGGDW